MFQLSADFTPHRSNTFRGKQLFKMPHCPSRWSNICVLTIEVLMKSLGSILEHQPCRSIPRNHPPPGVSGSLQVTVHKSRASSVFLNNSFFSKALPVSSGVPALHRITARPGETEQDLHARLIRLSLAACDKFSSVWKCVHE